MTKKALAVGLLSGGLVLAAVLATPKVYEEFSTMEGSVDSARTTATGGTVQSQGTSGETSTTRNSESTGLRNVMYYSDWSIWGGQGNYYPQDLPTEYYTHLNYCFLDFDSAGNLMFTDTDASVGASLNQNGVVWGEVNAGIIPVLLAQRAENPNMKLGISVGGWSKSGDFSLMTANDSTRANFVNQIMKFLEYTGFDFIDIDWEYPAVVRQPDYVDNQLDEGTPSASPADKENYIKLLSDLRTAMDEQGQQLGKTYELSVALPMSQEKLEAGIDLSAMFEIIDFGNMMTYDARGAFDDVSGHHSPLYGNPEDPFYDKGYSVDQTVQYLLENAVPSEKIVIGTAFYSRGWENIQNTEIVSGLPGLFAPVSTGTSGALNDLPVVSGDGGIPGGVWAYRNFDTLKASYSNLVEYWDDVAKAPYLYNGSAFFTYDNPQSIAEKVNYVHEHNLGGMISWQASNDAVTDTPLQRDELTRAIYDGLFGGEPLTEYEVVDSPVNVTLEISNVTANSISFTLKNLEQIQEVSGVLQPLEKIQETILFPILYIDAGGLEFTSGGYGTGTVSQQGQYTVVNLAEVYENRFLSQGQSIQFTLNFSGDYGDSTLNSICLYQRNTLTSPEYAPQVLMGEGKIEIPSTGTTTPSTGTTTPSTGTTTPDTGTTTPEVNWNPSSPVGTLEQPVEWSREEEATGAYVPNSFVSYEGKIYQQVSGDTLWWEEPSKTSTGWAVVGEVVGYVAPPPTEWNREDEAIGLYKPDTMVTYQGKTYVQVSNSVAWWCEPGTDDNVWQEQVKALW